MPSSIRTPVRSNVKRVKGTKKRSSKFKNAFLPMVNMGIGFPSKCTATLKYNSTYTLSSIAGTGAYNWCGWRANGLNDPDYQAGGHQPMYFDQYMYIYNHYVVTKSKITVKVVPAESNTAAGRIVIHLNDDGVMANSDLSSYIEQNGTSKTMLFGSVDTNTQQALVCYFDSKKVFGGDYLANNALQGTSATDPTEMSLFVVGIESVTASQTTCYLDVSIEYTAIFSELRDMVKS